MLLPGALSPVRAADFTAPRGQFAELHSCEVFAGPCVVNSEVDQPGNYQLRVWQFDYGSVAGVSLRGLTLALLETSDENLADRGHAAEAVAYLPPGVTPAQRNALLAWARQSTFAKLDAAYVKIAPLQAEFTSQKMSFTAGGMTFTGRVPEACNVGGCGEMLWYQPRTTASSFAVDLLDESRIDEPLLSLHWMDHGRKTLFVGRFGDPEVVVPALCGAPRTAAL